MASADQKKQKVLKAKKTMPTSCRKQLESLNKAKNVEVLKTTVERDIPNGHNQKRTFSANKENVKRMKTSEQINGNACVALERQTALLEQVKYWIQQEIYRINCKLFDKKMNELSERIVKAECKNKHEAIAGELFVKIGRLQRHIKTIQENCLESNTVISSTVCKTANSETIQNLTVNQESVNGPNEKVTSMNCETFNSAKKTSKKNDLPSACAKFISKSNTDDAMLMKNPNSTSPIASNPTENPTFNLKYPLKAVSSTKEVIPVAANGTEAFDSFEHLPPLPEPPSPFPPLAEKIRDTLPPQKPELRVKRVLRPLGIALTWNIAKVNPKCAPVESYHLFLCCEDANHLTWKKIGEIKALPLPMACTLSQFLSSNKYYFTVQSKDIFGRYGPFCDIKSIPGFSENLT
ncbi:activating transcription factor 7-interacting protein 2 isoform X1 [Nannospalax galili]|uniref:activating transcription factor 7-interacting protein 2 isoform X1 n=1 Tax=Nannospalax galili TaxID=1026970 RepID=UPI0004ED0680|nr:activating transcription factor 7-interacting protein 2 isoform X1 [Nannospalax galili]